MRRRTVLATLPWAVPLAFGHVKEKASKPSVFIRVIGTLHPRVWRSIKHLNHVLGQVGYSPVLIEGNAAEPPTGRQIVVAITEKSNQPELQRMGWEPRGARQPESFEVHADRRIVWVLGSDSRSLVYALSQLQRFITRERCLPVSLTVERSPLFPIRRWSTAVSHHFGSPWDERIHLTQRFAYIKSEVFTRAADYGMNSIELNGRPGDGWDIDWVIGYERYPELASLISVETRRERVRLVEDLARSAHDNLLDIFVWNHELHLPPGFTDLYPQTKGTEYPVCLSNEFLKAFIRNKYIEFFSGAPSIDGVVISVNESGQFSLLTDAGCKCDRCSQMTQHDRLMAILNEVISATSQLNKQIVLRTFQGAWIHDLNGHPELETIRRAYSGLPTQVQIMSKYCPLDFYGGEIADEPLIGAFSNSHIVEFSLDVEWQGRTFVPVLTPENFRRRVAHALRKKCVGIVARIDFPFPQMEPEPIFGHPNEFNAFYMGEILWSPHPELDDLMLHWSHSTYGKETAALLSGALRRTEAITQKTFFALGHTVINYHNMLASVSFCDNALWNHALSKWDSSKKELSESFFNPSDDLIRRALTEKQQAIELASEALSQIRLLHETIGELGFQRLLSSFEKLHDTAQLWAYLLELYLRRRQIDAFSLQPGVPSQSAVIRNEGLSRLLESAQKVLTKAVQMELRHGKDSWPVASPDRGISAYEFVNQILRQHIVTITGEPAEDRVVSKLMDQVMTVPVYETGTVENLWRRLIECGRPGFNYGDSAKVELRWPEQLSAIQTDSRGFTLKARNGQSLVLPVSCRVSKFDCSAATDVAVLITKSPEQLRLEQL